MDEDPPAGPVAFHGGADAKQGLGQRHEAVLLLIVHGGETNVTRGPAQVTVAREIAEERAQSGVQPVWNPDRGPPVDRLWERLIGLGLVRREGGHVGGLRADSPPGAVPEDRPDGDARLV